LCPRISPLESFGASQRNGNWAILTEYLADTGIVHVGTRLEYGPSFLARPDHERVHRPLDMLLLLLLMMMMMTMLMGAAILWGMGWGRAVVVLDGCRR